MRHLLLVPLCLLFIGCGYLDEDIHQTDEEFYGSLGMSGIGTSGCGCGGFGYMSGRRVRLPRIHTASQHEMLMEEMMMEIDLEGMTITASGSEETTNTLPEIVDPASGLAAYAGQVEVHRHKMVDKHLEDAEQSGEVDPR